MSPIRQDIRVLELSRLALDTGLHAFCHNVVGPLRKRDPLSNLDIAARMEGGLQRIQPFGLMAPRVRGKSELFSLFPSSSAYLWVKRKDLFGNASNRFDIVKVAVGDLNAAWRSQ